MSYDHKHLEEKWQSRWNSSKINELDMDSAENPFFNLMMFPYPSAEGLHIGSVYTFSGVDTFGRFNKMKGRDVFEPIGLDGFGIHSENFAIKIGEHIRDVSKRTEEHFYEQMRRTGNMYDWSRTVETYKPNYYKWTQWLFLQLFKAGLAYRKKQAVNWCPNCKTVLSNEQVEEHRCERCKTEVTKRDLEQWFFKITDYADRLLDNLSWLDWDSDVKIGQENWIGRSRGASVNFDIEVGGESIDSKLEVFTTRPDTIFGATFMVIAPEHPLLINSKSKIQNSKEIENYVKEAKMKSDLERTDLNKDKSGIKIEGIIAKNPLTGEELPIFVADYVLINYGTGAIMGVPAHDERDFEFARKYGLPIIKVIDFDNELHSVVRKDLVSDKFSELLSAEDIFVKELDLEHYAAVATEEKIDKLVSIVQEELTEDGFAEVDGKYKGVITKSEIVENEDEFKSIDSTIWKLDKGNYKFCYTGPGTTINSQFLDGLEKKVSIDKINQYLEEKVLGKSETTYRLRDWVISRQRYWGPPIPMIHCEKCKGKGEGYYPGEMPGWWPVEEKDLPVLLPEIEEFEDILPDGSGKGPLEKQGNFVNTKCPHCGAEAKRETDVSDPFVDSSWYFLRYPFTEDEKNPFGFVSKSEIKGEVGFDNPELDKEFFELYELFEKEGLYPIVNGSMAVTMMNGGYFKPLNDFDFAFPKQEYAKEAMKLLTNKGYEFDADDGTKYVLRKDDITIDLGYKDLKESILPYSEMYLGHKINYKGTRVRIVDPGLLVHLISTGPKKDEPISKVKLEIIEKWMEQRTNRWLPVDYYIGGKEHTVLHLLYARFITMVMNDLGYLDFEEPFKTFYGHGLITKDGSKMSKSRGNVINPDEYFDKFGADAVRMYLRFLGPFDQGGDWRDTGMKGMQKFVNKIWDIYQKFVLQHIDFGAGVDNMSKLHQTIKGVGEDLENLRFNTAVAKLMELVNWYKENEQNFDKEQTIDILKSFALLLAPLAPHIAEELWETLNFVLDGDWEWSVENSVHSQSWPSFDPKLLITDVVKIVVQINGKMRGIIETGKDSDQDSVKSLIYSDKRYEKYNLSEAKNVIFVKNKIINFVV